MVFMIAPLLNAVVQPLSPPETAEEKGTRMLFVVQMDREKNTLDADAGLIAFAIQLAQPGDFIEGMTISGKPIFSFQMEKQSNLLQAKRAKNSALNLMRQFFLEHLSKKSPQNIEQNDVAAALTRAIKRFNAEAKRQRYVLILLTDGLQRDKSVDFRGGYPSDSWVVHPTSPFSAIPQNETGKPIEVIFIHQADDYTNAFHAQKIERWYTLLLHRKKVQLIEFTEDHQTASELIKGGKGESRTQKTAPQPEEIDGSLILYRVSVEKQTGSVSPLSPAPFVERVGVGSSSIVYEEQRGTPNIKEVRQEAKPSVRLEKPAQVLTGSIFNLAVENGTATLWVSVRDPQGNPVKNLRPENFQVWQHANGQSQQIPAASLTLQPHQERKPLALVLLMDASTSLEEDGLRDAQKAVQTSLDKMKSGDLVALLHFSETVSVVQDFCTDVSALKRAARYPPAYRGGTALWDALFFAIDLCKRQENRFLKAVIAFTDGMDTGSQTSPKTVIHAAQKASLPLFLIGVGNVDEATLMAAAENSGGLYFSAAETQALQKIYATLSGVLNYTYLISYPTQAKTGEEVEVEVTANYTQGKEHFQGQFSSVR
jgi:VWFA-related protein